MNRVRFLPKIALAASLSLAMVFTLSCSSNDGGDDDNDENWYNEESSSYNISSERGLKEIQELVASGVEDFSGKTITLKKNIALTENWIPIGSDSIRPFLGIFDGGNNTISGLSVSGVRNAGLFGYVGKDGQIKNLKVIATKIKTDSTGTRNYAGGLAAVYASSMPIENSSVQADSIIAVGTRPSGNNGYACAGGLVGSPGNDLVIKSCHVNANVYASAISNYVNVSAGGLICGSIRVTIEKSYAIGSVFTIANTSTSRTENGTARSGGLVSSGNFSIIKESYFNGTTSAQGGDSYSGGLIAEENGGNGGSISNSYARGNISSSGTGSFSGGVSGGLIGSVSSGGVSSRSITISNSYHIGNVSASGYNSKSGGVLGHYGAANYSDVSSVYHTSYNAESQGSPSGTTRLSTESFKNKDSFKNWDFDYIWGIESTINDGYPYLLAIPPNKK